MEIASDILGMLGWVFLVLAWAGTVYALMAAWLVHRLPQAAESAASYPPMSLLKPLYGDEPQLTDNLASFFAQDYPAPCQILFGVQHDRDPALNSLAPLRARYANADTDLIAGGAARHGANGKICNLVNMSAAIRHDVVVVSDSDIRVDSEYLKRLAAALAPDDVGAVTCLYSGFAAVDGLGAKLSAMGINYHFLPNVVVGLALGLAKPCMGSTIAIKRAVLNKIGGFEAFADFLADDYEIGRAVRAAGYRVAIPGMVVRHGCAEAGLGACFAHDLRWARTIRINDLAGHIGSVITHPVPLAVIAMIFLGFSWVSVGTFAATLVARSMLKWAVDARFAPEHYSVWLLPVRDVLSFVVFGFSLLGGRVMWRGAQMRVSAAGVMSKD